MRSPTKLIRAVLFAAALLSVVPTGVAFAQGPLTNGQMHTGSISAAAETDTWTFTVAQNDAITISIGEILPGGPDPGFDPWIRLRNPNGVQVASASGSLAAQINVSAALSGTYTVVVASGDYYNTATGAYRLTLAKTPGAFVVPAGDQGGPLVNGSDHPGDIYTGDVDQWSFQANLGERIALIIGETLPAGPDPGFNPWIRLVGPTGAVIGNDSGGLVAQINVNAPLSGTYTVLVASGDYYGHAAGSYRLTLAKAPGTFTVPSGDQGGAMVNGQNHAGDIYVGDLDTWTFTASQSDYISLIVGEPAFGEVDPGFDPWIRLIGPTGLVLGSSSGSRVAQIAVNAPLSGTYTVLISSGDYYGHAAGSYIVTLAKVPGTLTLPVGDQGGALTNGLNHPGAIYVGDQDGWTFQANQNDYIALSAGEPPFGEIDPGFNPWLRLIGPTGAVIGNNSGTLVGQINLRAPLSGTYTVLVASGDYYGHNAGNYRLTLAKSPGVVVIAPDDQGGPLDNGRIHSGSIHVGDRDHWTFHASQHDAIMLKIGEPPFGEVDPGFDPWIRLVRPDGLVIGNDSGALIGQINVTDAPLSGTYSVIVGSGDYYGHAQGSYLLTLAKTPGDFVVTAGDHGGPMTNRAPHAGSIYRGDLDQWTFYAGQSAALALTITEPPFGEIDPGFDPWIRLLSPTGAQLRSASGVNGAVINISAPLSGLYTVIVGSGDYYGHGAGNYVLSVSGASDPPTLITVTPSVTGGGTISPAIPQLVTPGATPSFTLTPAAGYAVSGVTGTCGGRLVGRVFTTTAVAANCTVTAAFAPRRPGLDMNGDGTADLLLQDSSSTWVGAWLLDNAGHPASFLPIYSANIGTWKVVGTADLNGDGIADIVLQDSSSTWVGAWLLDSAGQTVSFLPIYSANIGGWKVVGTADLNGDGIADIVLQDSGSTWVGAWLMDGAGRTASFLPIYSANIGGWKVVGTADLNGDGIADIVLQDSGSTWVGAWLMDGAGRTASFLPIYSANIGTWKVVGTADLNGDGMADIVLQDSSATWVGAWLMDGVGHTTSFLPVYSANIGTWKVNGRN